MAVISPVQSSQLLSVNGAVSAPGQITSLSTATLERSGYLEIFGENFGGDGTVLIGGVSAPVADWQNTRIVAYVPESTPLTSVPVQLMNGSGEASNALNLTVTARQSNGRVNWRFRQDGPYSQVRPVIGPDGTVYSIDAFNHLYALTPSGGLKWLVRGAGSGGLAVGPDGAIYCASETTIKAFNPDGSPRWTFAENPGALFLVGISVGPDGNIYVVATEGVGAFSLTPAGTLRWAHPEPYDARHPVIYQELVFGLNGNTPQLYFFANHHLKAYRLDGSNVFTLDMDFGQPSVAPNGSIHGSYASFSPVNGSTQWFFSSPYSYNVATPSDIGADGTHYFVQNLGELFALNSNGSVRWHRTLDQAFAGPIVDPANTQLILGSATTLDNPGYIISASTQDGHQLWRVDLPPEDGFNQSTDTRARFSPDGAAAYMITFTATGDNNTSRSFVYSLNTSADGAPMPTSVVSRKVHGSAGVFDIDLPLSGSAGIECRNGGTSNEYQIVFTFPTAVTVSGAGVTPEAGKSASVAGPAVISTDGRTVTLNLTNVTDAQTIAINLLGVNNAASTSDVSVPMSLLVGDTNGNGVINASDVSQTKLRSGQPVTNVTFRSDVAVNGTINASDLGIVKSRSGASAQ